MNSYTGIFSPRHFSRPTDLTVAGVEKESAGMILWKQQQYDWGLLQGLWSAPGITEKYYHMTVQQYEAYGEKEISERFGDVFR